jgi:hypothetical protein
MSHQVLINPFFSVNGSDLTGHVKRIEINNAPDIVDDTCSTNLAKNNLGGQFDWTVTVEMSQEETSAAAYAENVQFLFDLQGLSAAIVIRNKTAAVSTTNRQLSAVSLIGTIDNPLGGTVGELATETVTFHPKGQKLAMTSA